MRSVLAFLLLLGAVGCAGPSTEPRRDPEPPEPTSVPAVEVDGGAAVDGGTAVAAATDGGSAPAADGDSEVLPPSVGLAAYFMTNVFAEPRFESKRIGWIRVGQKFEIGPRLPGDDKCRDGFHALTKSRGFVCAGKGIVVGRYPGTLRRGTMPAKRDALVPYDYGYVRADGTPLYRRAPTWAQVREIEYPEEPDAGPSDVGSASPPAEPGAEGEGEAVPQPVSPPPPTQEPVEEEEDEDEDEELDTHGGLIVRRMQEGFILSIDRQLGEWPNLLYRTIRGQWVNARKIHKMRPTTFRGVEIAREGPSMPVAFAAGRARARFERNTKGRILQKGQVDRHFGFVVAQEIEERRVRWLQALDGSFFRAQGLTIVRPATPPPDLAEGEKWIDVDIPHQTLVAYEGTRAVYATLVSSGSESRGFATPPGSFRIKSKHVTFTMDGDMEGDGAYSIEDVPYVMYYDLNYALHAAFWHSYFGRQRSHGCVNLSAADARWLFDWVEPALPEGWYGVWSTDDHPGTRVVIRSAPAGEE
jgi:lipoprotein-anchoring transpeptidase ErfK/SrfK